MARMYVANATHQSNDFMYQVPESTKVMRMTIPPGNQVMLAGVNSSEDVKAVVDHHAKYGMIAVDDIPRSRGMCGLCYSIDRPVKQDQIVTLIRRNGSVLHQRGREAHEAAAIAVNQGIERDIMERRMPDMLKELEMTVIEESRSTPVFDRGEYDAELARELADAPVVADGVKVRRDAPQRKTSGRRRRADA